MFDSGEKEYGLFDNGTTNAAAPRFTANTEHGLYGDEDKRKDSLPSEARTKYGLFTTLSDRNHAAYSHATGLLRVPFNGYAAKLHAGEAVLTAPEAERWRQETESERAAQGYPETARDARDGCLLIDGKRFARQQAANTREAMAERARRLAAGYGK